MSTNLPISSGVSLINAGEERLTGSKYRIPAYQRPYSWSEENIDDFLKTIIDGFNENSSKFFGTMQFVVKSTEYEVVDGQQRLTTMKLFNYVLSGLAEKKSFDFCIDYKNMKTANKDIADLLTQDIKTVQETVKNKRGKVDIRDISSVFEANIRMLKEKIQKYCEDDIQKRDIKHYACDLLDYFGENIYVVVLKTDKELPLPEVVNIFNTINTTGMDLNTEDIFKFQYYEYLRKNETCSESIGNDDYWIEKINGCYRKIEEFNEGKPIKMHISMSEVLTIYQHCICSKYEDDYKTLAKSSERFFEDVFKDAKKYEGLLKFSEFERLVDLYIEFYSELENNKYVDNPLHSVSVDLIKQTRYPRYWTFPYVYSYFKGSDFDTRKKALSIGYHIFSYLIVHSINYAKAVNPVHTVMCKDVLPAIQDDNKDITAIMKVKQWSDPYIPDTNERAKKYFCDNLEKNAIRISKTGVICLLLSLFYEKDNNLKSLKDKFFNWEMHPYDIEHIYSYDSFWNDTQFNDDDKAYFNGLGNLILLDQKINRDMGRKRILLPSEKYAHRLEYYEKSIYNLVKDFTPKLEKWNISDVKQRCESQLKRITEEILNMDKN